MSGEVSGVMRGDGPKLTAAAAASELFKAAICECSI
jgi:hypothetical protein